MNKNYLPFYNSLNDKEKTFWLDCTKEELIDHLIANINNGKKLLERIDKEIEYIKENFDKTGICVSGSDLPYSYIEELLEILQNDVEEQEQSKIKFLLNGCDISFYAIAPEDITLKQLLKQCDRIKPNYCACGICSSNFEDEDVELIIDYDDIKKANDDVSCEILGDKENE